MIYGERRTEVLLEGDRMVQESMLSEVRALSLSSLSLFLLYLPPFLPYSLLSLSCPLSPLPLHPPSPLSGSDCDTSSV